MRKNIFILILIASLSIWLYFPILGDFFQQDEWAGFSDYYQVDGGNYLKYVAQSFIPDPGHYVPLFKILFATSFKLFQFDYWKWASLSILWHILNSVLVYILAKRLFKDEIKSILTSLLFIVFAAGQQATSWAVADGATHGATFFVLLSLIFFTESKILISILMLTISMLFKEISIAMFAFYPLLIMYQNHTNKLKILDKNIFYFVAAGITYFIFRYLTFLGIFSNVAAPVITESQGLNEILFNVFTFPVKGISQTIVPPYVYLEASKFVAVWLPDGITGLPGTTYFDNFYLQYVSGALVLGVFIIVLLLTIFVIKAKKGKVVAIALFGLLFTALNSMIYALSPGRSSSVPIIDSRNLYLPSVGIIFLIASVASSFRNFKWGVLVISLFIVFNIAITRQELNKISTIGGHRQGILQQIYRDNLKLSNKQIFYFESDTSYYGLPDEVRILPFQSGMGKTLLVWYQNTEKFPLEFFRDSYLWPIDSQGYKEVKDRGFGYFREFDLLKVAIKEYNLPVDSVVAYSWNSKENKLTDITEKVRLKLKK